MTGPRPWPGRRPAWVEVDLDAITANIRQLARVAAPAPVMAVVKADAYGHGAVPVARAAVAAGAAWLGVALVEEALELRAAGITAPVLMLQEPPPDAADDCARHDITAALGTPAGARALAAAGRRAGRPVHAHLKVDTGMHRQGCAPQDVPDLVRAALAADGLVVDGVWTHLALADEPGRDHDTKAHLNLYEQAVAAATAAGLAPRWRHAANSAATFRHPEARLGLVRPGITVYGLDPAPGWPAQLRAGLRPALRLAAAVTALRTVEAGEGVSYGHLWTAPRRTRIATVPVGYADGVRRGLSGRMQVLVHGRLVPQVGRVTMDQILLDVGDAGLPGAADPGPPVHVGDTVVLLGDPDRGEPAVADWSGLLGTIDYEITCGLSARLPRVHVSGGAPPAPEVPPNHPGDGS